MNVDIRLNFLLPVMGGFPFLQTDPLSAAKPPRLLSFGVGPRNAVNVAPSDFINCKNAKDLKLNSIAFS